MQPIFSRNINIDKIAFLNWRITEDADILNLLNLADGFLLSSIELARHCLLNNDDKRADILIFPILSNANHGIELYLKAILWTLNRLSNLEQKIEGKHNIKQIFETIRARIKTYKGQISIKEFDKLTIELKNYINELFYKIKATPKNDKMDFSRYPFSNRFENHFYVDTLGNVEIDLENFVTQITSIYKNLENLSDFLYYNELNRDWYN
jgi:hypothetical protein